MSEKLGITRFLRDINVRTQIDLATIALLLLLLNLSSTGMTEEVKLRVGAASLVKDVIELTSNFDGDQLLIFGVVNTNCTIVTKVTGPKVDVVIGKKDRLYGAWLKESLVRLGEVDTFFTVISSSDTLSEKIMGNLHLDKKYLHYNVLHAAPGADYSEFLSQYFNYKTRRGEFDNPNNKMEFINKNFFKVSIDIPKTSRAGQYLVEVFFIKNGNVIDKASLPFLIKNTYKDSLLKHLAYEYSLLYAITTFVGTIFLVWIIGLFGSSD